MNILKNIKERSYIPLLDKEFDTKPIEIDHFIFSHKNHKNEECYVMKFNKKSY